MADRMEALWPDADAGSQATIETPTTETPTTETPTPAPPATVSPARGGDAIPNAQVVTGAESILRANDGTFRDPASPEEWDDWVSAGRTRNHAMDDPLLDWLERYGAQHGFARDDAVEGYDSRTDYLKFILERGAAFEDAVMAIIRRQFGHGAIATIRATPEDVRSLDRARQTFDAMRAGVPFVAQAVLRNPERRTYGAVDLLVRSDYVNRLVPDTLTAEEVAVSAPALARSPADSSGRPGATGPAALPPWHYRAVDIKFHTLDLMKDGHVSGAGDTLPYHLQVWLYNEALGRLQGYLPPAGFLLGRAWKQGDNRGLECFDRLGRIDQERARKSDGRSVAELAEEAVRWVRRLRAEGGGWRVLPEPSVPELYPHMRNARDQPWHGAKTTIAREIAELTLLPGMNPGRRREAGARGITRWDDPTLDPSALGIGRDSSAIQCAGVLEANRAPRTERLFPTDRISHADQAWRTAVAHEFYVDFETVSNLADDFTQLPRIGGQPLIFQIGCGRWEGGAWRFEQWTVGALTESEEARIIDAFLAHVRALTGADELDPARVRIFGWSKAEPSTFDTAYNSARNRQPERDWPASLPWYDVLQNVMRAEPVTVRGAFNFGLKSIVRAMKDGGLIETDWADSPLDGLGAMIGAWWCAAEAATSGLPMSEIELMREIGRYNEVDCRTMAEIIGWLRVNR